MGTRCNNRVCDSMKRESPSQNGGTSHGLGRGKFRTLLRKRLPIAKTDRARRAPQTAKDDPAWHDFVDFANKLLFLTNCQVIFKGSQFVQTKSEIDLKSNRARQYTAPHMQLARSIFYSLWRSLFPDELITKNARHQCWWWSLTLPIHSRTRVGSSSGSCSRHRRTRRRRRRRRIGCTGGSSSSSNSRNEIAAAVAAI